MDGIADGGGEIARRGPFRRQEVVGVGVAREGYVMPGGFALMDGKPDGAGCAHLDGGDADLAVALGEVAVAGGVEAAGNGDGDEETGAGGELLGVDVAAVFPGRNGAQALIGDSPAGGHGVLRVGGRGLAAPLHPIGFAGGPGG